MELMEMNIRLDGDDVEDLLEALEAYAERLLEDDSVWADEVLGNLVSLRDRLIGARSRQMN